MPCEDCKKKSLCTGLCPEAEIIANQDYVSLREDLTSEIKAVQWPDILREVSLTRQESTILIQLLQTASIKQTAKATGLTSNHVRVVLHHIRKKYPKIIPIF